MLEIHQNVILQKLQKNKQIIAKLILKVINKLNVKKMVLSVSCVVNLNMVLTLKLKDKNVYNNVD